MLIVQVARTFVVAVVLVLTATGLWAAGADEHPAAAAEKEMVLDPTTGEMVERRSRGTISSNRSKETFPSGRFLYQNGQG